VADSLLSLEFAPSGLDSRAGGLARSSRGGVTANSARLKLSFLGLSVQAPWLDQPTTTPRSHEPTPPTGFSSKQTKQVQLHHVHIEPVLHGLLAARGTELVQKREMSKSQPYGDLVSLEQVHRVYRTLTPRQHV